MEAVFEADRSAKVDPEKDLSDERKEQWATRIRAEDEALKAGNVVQEFWYERKGDKLIKKIKKKKGGAYSFYVGNVKRHPELMDDPEVKANYRSR